MLNYAAYSHSVQLYEVWESQKTYFLLMDFIENGSITDII
jgi:hypothetical protein